MTARPIRYQRHFAGAGQDLDTGAKVVHAAPHTTSHISTKSIARDGGVSNFRSSVVVLPNAAGSKSSVSCESLMLDDRSRSDTIPAMDKRGQHFKDWFCPDSMEFAADHFKLDARYGRVLYLQDYASYIKDSFVSELCWVKKKGQSILPMKR